MQEDQSNYMIAYVKNEQIKIPLIIERPNCVLFRYSDQAWNACVLNYATSLKKRLENGDTLNTSIEEHMAQWARENIITITFSLFFEELLLKLDLNIVKSLQVTNPQPFWCIDLLYALNKVPVTPLILKKRSNIVFTIRKVMRYSPPVPEGFQNVEATAFLMVNALIRRKAGKIYRKFESLFQVPPNMTFLNYFKKETELFENQIKDLPSLQAQVLIEDVC